MTVFHNRNYSQNIAQQLMQDFPQWIIEKGDMPHPEAKMLGLGLFTHTRPLFEQYSVVKKLFAGTKNKNFYLREKNTDSLVLLLEPDKNNYWSIDNSMWSPSGNYIAVKQIDDYKVPEIEITNSDSNEVIHRKYTRAGEELPAHKFYIVNTVTGEKIAIQQNLNLPYIHLLDWSIDDKNLYFLMADRLLKKVSLNSVDVKTGKSTTLLTEASETYLIGLNLLQGYSERLKESNQFVLLEEREQFSWMSERNGYNQIYLYDKLGNFVRPLTNITENGIVTYLSAIDKQNGWIYFLAHSNNNNPYDNQLFRTSLNTPRIEKITGEPGIMDAFFREDIDTLWVLRSNLPKTLQLDRYSVKGEYYDTPWEALTSITSKNLLNYEYETTLAADGITELQSLI